MPDISITVTDKRPVCTAGTTVVCDNSDYIVHWDLDEEWSAYDTKTMRVIYMDSTYADIVFSGDIVALPPVPVPGCVQIGLYAGDIHTSRMALLRALSSVRSASGAPANPTPDVYNQLMELIKGLGSVDPDDIAKAVADYLAAHPIEETDPTVPSWAKAETKPTYSAEEVGAIAQSDLQAATDAALAQAKSSGEFDGATGPAGPQGPAGAPGKDGTPGADGVTPHIGDNGNWYIGSTDTGKPSRGATGANGQDGAQGEKGDTGPQGPQGPAGPTGSDASVTAANIEAAMGYKPADPTKYLPLTGGKLTGNLEGKYITGTRLKSTDAGHQESAAAKVAVLDAQGWIYYRTPAELMADMGIADGTEVSY
nr:MAG TPA: collagen alpha 1(VIII) chain protein [Caudoviricetes sp.]